MDIAAFILFFILGFAAGAAVCFFNIAPETEEKKQTPIVEEDENMFRQYINFLNYDGTERGQNDKKN